MVEYETGAPKFKEDKTMTLRLKPFLTEASTQPPEHYMKLLALESSHIHNVVETFREMLPSFKNSIEVAVSSLNPYTHDISDTYLCNMADYKDLSKKLQHLNYLTVGQVMVNVPENISCTLLVMSETLNDMLPELYKGALNILGDYNTFLASFITNKEIKTSVRDYSAFYLGIKEKRETMVKDLAACYVNQEIRDTQRLKTVLDRLSDIPTVVAACDKLTKQRATFSLERIDKEVSKAVSLLASIIKDTGDVEKVTGVSATNLSNGAYEVAKYVEFMGVFYYKITALNKTVGQMVSALNKNF